MLNGIPSNSTQAVTIMFAVQPAADGAVAAADVVDALQTASASRGAATLGFGFPKLIEPPELLNGWSPGCLSRSLCGGVPAGGCAGGGAYFFYQSHVDVCPEPEPEPEPGPPPPPPPPPPADYSGTVAGVLVAVVIIGGLGLFLKDRIWLEPGGGLRFSMQSRKSRMGYNGSDDFGGLDSGEPAGGTGIYAENLALETLALSIEH